MTTFADQVRAFAVTVDAATQAAFVNTCAAAKDSIVFGSPVTGAPGQPVETGNLRESWQLEFLSPTEALISTNVVYASENEYGVRQSDGRPYTQRSRVGGRHSVALTRTSFSRLLDDVVNSGVRPSGFQDNTVLGGSGS